MPITPLFQRFRSLPPSDHDPLPLDTNLDMAHSNFETVFGSARDAPRPGAAVAQRAIRRVVAGRACTHQTELAIPETAGTGWPLSNRSCTRTLSIRHAAWSAPHHAPGTERNHDCQRRRDFEPVPQRPQVLTFAPVSPQLPCDCRHNTVHLRNGGT